MDFSFFALAQVYFTFVIENESVKAVIGKTNFSTRCEKLVGKHEIKVSDTQV